MFDACAHVQRGHLGGGDKREGLVEAGRGPHVGRASLSHTYAAGSAAALASPPKHVSTQSLRSDTRSRGLADSGIPLPKGRGFGGGDNATGGRSFSMRAQQQSR